MKWIGLSVCFSVRKYIREPSELLVLVAQAGMFQIRGMPLPEHSIARGVFLGGNPIHLPRDSGTPCGRRGEKFQRKTGRRLEGQVSAGAARFPRRYASIVGSHANQAKRAFLGRS